MFRAMLKASVPVLVLSSAAHAVLIAPGVTAAVVFELGPVGGTVLASSANPFVGTDYTGTFTSTVVSGDTSNPLGGLTFVYTIQNNATSTHSIERMAVNGFAGFLTDFSCPPVPGPNLAFPAFNDRDAGGNVIGFRFFGAPIGTGVIAPGLSTVQMVVQTNAANYGPTSAIVIDGSVATVDSFAPRVVPEPTLGAMAVAALAPLRRRR